MLLYKYAPKLGGVNGSDRMMEGQVGSGPLDRGRCGVFWGHANALLVFGTFLCVGTKVGRTQLGFGKRRFLGGELKTLFAKTLGV